MRLGHAFGAIRSGGAIARGGIEVRLLRALAQRRPEAIRAVHALILEEHGHLGGTRYQTLSEGHYRKGPVLTMTGADLADSVSERGLWNKMKSIAKETGVRLAFDSMSGLAKLVIGQMLAPTA